jgi:hypothetical protein
MKLEDHHRFQKFNRNFCNPLMGDISDLEQDTFFTRRER